MKLFTFCKLYNQQIGINVVEYNNYDCLYLMCLNESALTIMILSGKNIIFDSSLNKYVKHDLIK